MSQKNKVIVRIHGQEYKLMSDDTREYMQGLANFVDDRMQEIANGNSKLSTAMMAVLTALNIADDYYKLKSQYEDLVARYKNPLYDVDLTRKQVDGLSKELDKRNADYEVIIGKFEELMQRSAVYEEEMDNLREKLNVLSHELYTKEKQLGNSDEQIKQLEVQVDHLKTRKDTIQLTD
jgi:cell division protein ZapA